MATKKPSHRRNDSGELDVFEAARYFSGYNDNYALVGGANMNPTKMVIKEEREGYMRERRISLDIPSIKHHHYHHPNAQPQKQQQQQQKQQQQQQQIKDKKYKQPSSPGGKLAHFLNSLFSQTSSRKKKSSKLTTQSMKDIDDESPNGRRKRRSSISHFRSTSSAVDAKSIYSTSSNSGFRTPPPYNLNTPIKSYKDFRSFCDHKEVLATLSNYNVNDNNGNANGNAKKDEKVRGSNVNMVDEKFKFKNGVVEKPNNNLNHGYQDQKKIEINKFKEELDDGADSDSSSDLFELQIDYEFGFCSSGLPVYETTHMDSIKRSSATGITNGPLKN